MVIFSLTSRLLDFSRRIPVRLISTNHVGSLRAMKKIVHQTPMKKQAKELEDVPKYNRKLERKLICKQTVFAGFHFSLYFLDVLGVFQIAGVHLVFLSSD